MPVDQTWIDTIGGNVANMNDGVTPGQPVYQAQYVDAAAQAEPGDPQSTGDGYGVHVQSVVEGPAQGQIEYDPTDPVANAQGDVEFPVVDLGIPDDRPRPVPDLLSGQFRRVVSTRRAPTSPFWTSRPDVIPAIPSISSALAAGASQAAAVPTATTAPTTTGAATSAAGSTAAAGTSQSSFSDVLGNAIDSLDSSQQAATNLSIQAASGNANIADVTVASTEADLETQMVTAVRDKAVTAFNSIMDMSA